MIRFILTGALVAAIYGQNPVPVCTVPATVTPCILVAPLPANTAEAQAAAVLGPLMSGTMPTHAPVKPSPVPAPQANSAPQSSQVATTPSPAAAPAQPQYWIAVGASFNNGGSPKFGGLASFGYRLTANTYSYTTESFTSVNALSGSTSTSIRTGIATQVALFGPIRIWTLADAGGSSTSTGGIAGAFSGGGVVILQLAKANNLYLAGDIRIVKSGANSAPVFGILFGKSL